MPPRILLELHQKPQSSRKQVQLRISSRFLTADAGTFSECAGPVSDPTGKRPLGPYLDYVETKFENKPSDTPQISCGRTAYLTLFLPVNRIQRPRLGKARSQPTALDLYKAEHAVRRTGNYIYFTMSVGRTPVPVKYVITGILKKENGGVFTTSAKSLRLAAEPHLNRWKTTAKQLVQRKHS